MDHSLFISDLHLCDSRPHITQAFVSFLENIAVRAQALYILGDLFEYWAGDDSMDTGNHAESITALNQLNGRGIPIYLMHGNRDFLLSSSFENATGIKILPDPTLLTLYGKRVLLSHGDRLCTDDVTYQQFRNQVRTDKWKTEFASQPLASRIAYIEQLRAKSEQEKSVKSMAIMDVNKTAVEHLLAEYHYPPLLIHGHTHRPMRHLHTLNGHRCERWVLGDWYEQGSYLTLDSSGCHPQKL
ncbi:MAG: UDP-2,3-diacylglucosamine diphosphatase [Methylophilaceae bacterium]